ncbi:MAG: outer membrane protein assembly factor BamD [Candidatus Omnitrophica bacterium]|nr:outer membrane protein assembly factor BamD [Candidatus Omnitrophota bacterium]
MKEIKEKVILVGIFVGYIVMSGLAQIQCDDISEIENLYSGIKDKPPTISDISLCRKIVEKIEWIIQETKDPQILTKLYPILIECYDRQARYREKHRVIFQFALLFGRDTQMFYGTLKDKIDQIKCSEEERLEKMFFYKRMLDEYPDLFISPEIMYSIASIYECEQFGAFNDAVAWYLRLIKEYPNSEYAELSHLRLAKIYQETGKLLKAIDQVNLYLRNYPMGKYHEKGLFYAGLLYMEIKNKISAEKVWNQYISKFPNGVYSEIIKRLLNYQNNH